MARDNFIYVVIGARGTGKTDEIKGLIRKLSANFDKTVIVDTFDSEVWRNMKIWNYPDGENEIVPIIPVEMFPRFKKGIGRMFSGDTKMIMEAIQLHARNMLLVLEDSRKYIKSHITDDVQKFLADSKQKNLDVILVFHSIARVPTEILDLTDFLILKKTNDGKIPAKYNAFPEIKPAMEQLRASESKYKSIVIRLN